MPQPLFVTLVQVKYLVNVLEGVWPKGKADSRGGGGGSSSSRGGPRKEEAAGQEKESNFNKDESFEGLGNIAEAPKYLRIKGKVMPAAAAAVLRVK